MTQTETITVHTIIFAEDEPGELGSFNWWASLDDKNYFPVMVKPEPTPEWRDEFLQIWKKNQPKKFEGGRQPLNLLLTAKERLQGGQYATLEI